MFSHSQLRDNDMNVLLVKSDIPDIRRGGGISFAICIAIYDSILSIVSSVQNCFVGHNELRIW